MGNSLTFPVPGSAGLDEKVSRWVGRWRRGGIEQYSAGADLQILKRWRSRERFVVNQERIWLDALPDAFDGLRVVQISDIHHGLFLPKEWLVEAVRQANIEISSLSVQSTSLDDVFMHYTGRQLRDALQDALGYQPAVLDRQR